MCIITLTRIFHLTYQYPTLVREITTPHLPGFVTAALNLVSILVKLPSGSSRKAKPNTPFMEIVLHAILELLPRHPTIFRPFGSQLRSLLTEILGSSTPTLSSVPVLDVAGQLFASLYKCAPKDKSGTGWTDDCRATILSIHRAADHVFRAVVEQWESVDTTLVATRQNYARNLADEGIDALGFPCWEGIHSGVDRLITLLRILSHFISMPSASAVTIPLGQILDLTSRLTSVTAPADGSQGTQGSIRTNPQVGRDERELLWAELPRVHVACMDLLAHLANVLEDSTLPLTQTMLDQIAWVFRNERVSRDVRLATYELMGSLVSLNGPAMANDSLTSITNVLRFACVDILPQSGDASAPTSSQPDSKSKTKNGQGAVNADYFLNPELLKNRPYELSQQFPGLQEAASRLLRNVLASTPSGLLPASVRAEIDRTIILASDKNAMIASVLNPVPAVKGRAAGVSIMPFLVRSYPEQMDVEALVRPRMPVVVTTAELDAYTEVEEEETEENEEAAYGATTLETVDFLKEQTSAPVQIQSTELAPPLHKRTYVEEKIVQPPGDEMVLEKESVQSKKARLGEKGSESVAKSPLERQPSVVLTQASTSLSQPADVEPLGSQSTINIMAQQTLAPAASQPIAATPLPSDDSDDELPALNIDPDTEDEDEDDEDVAMEE